MKQLKCYLVVVAVTGFLELAPVKYAIEKQGGEA